MNNTVSTLHRAGGGWGHVIRQDKKKNKNKHCSRMQTGATHRRERNTIKGHSVTGREAEIERKVIRLGKEQKARRTFVSPPGSGTPTRKGGEGYLPILFVWVYLHNLQATNITK